MVKKQDQQLLEKIRSWGRSDDFPQQYIASVAIEEDAICVVTVGENATGSFSVVSAALKKKTKRKVRHKDHLQQPFHLLGGKPSSLKSELRPGSGIIRAYDGRPLGPAGTLTCFLNSRDKSDGGTYILASSHIVTNYWRLEPKDRDPRGSLYHVVKGYTSPKDRRYIGVLKRYTTAPPFAPFGNVTVLPASWPVVPVDDDELDAGIVELKGDFLCKQRTTCYGRFGDDFEADLRIMSIVTKCGAEEPHETFAKVWCKGADAFVFGPDSKQPYVFRNQILLTTRGETFSGRPFAALGDSGTMVVSKDTRTPVGMLIAGSVLSGVYVMTPFSTLRRFWDQGGYVLA